MFFNPVFFNDLWTVTLGPRQMDTVLYYDRRPELLKFPYHDKSINHQCCRYNSLINVLRKLEEVAFTGCLLCLVGRAELSTIKLFKPCSTI